jgi:hypothetical protein
MNLNTEALPTAIAMPTMNSSTVNHQRRQADLQVSACR